MNRCGDMSTCSFSRQGRRGTAGCIAYPPAKSREIKRAPERKLESKVNKVFERGNNDRAGKWKKIPKLFQFKIKIFQLYLGLTDDI